MILAAWAGSASAARTAAAVNSLHFMMSSLVRPHLSDIASDQFAVSRKTSVCEPMALGNMRANNFHVRYWPLADMGSCTAHVRFWG
jgi:hypothetical protein